MDTERIQLKPFLISLILLSLAEACRMVLLPGDPPSGAVKLAIIAGIRINALALFLGTMVLWGKGLRSLGLAKDQIGPGIKNGVIWSLGFGFLVIAGFGIRSFL